MKTMIVGLFDERITADKAIEGLLEDGMDRDRIGAIVRESGDAAGGQEIETVETTDVGAEASRGAAGGAIGGGATGATVGFLTSIGMLAIPGAGPFLAGGTLAATLAGAGVGAAGGTVTGGVIGAILGAADDDHGTVTVERPVYREGLERGGAIVTVDCEDDETDELRARMEDLGAAETDVYRETWLT